MAKLHVKAEQKPTWNRCSGY